MPGEKEFVKLADSAKDNGLAQMIKDLIGQNLERVPAKKDLAGKMKGSVYIFASDINLGVTIEFTGEEGIIVHGGKEGKPKLEVYADSITVIDLSRLSFKGPVPNFFDEVGRSILKKMLSGTLKVKGMLFHPIFVMKVLNVFSVM